MEVWERRLDPSWCFIFTDWIREFDLSFRSLEMPSSTCGQIWKGRKTSSLMRENVASHSPSD